MTTTRVEVEALTVCRGRRVVLDDCTTHLGPGVTVLLGGNGSGKSTFLSALVGLVPLRHGSVTIGGAPLRRRGLDRSQGRAVGYLPQDPHLGARLTVREAVGYSLWLRRLPDADGRVEAALDALGLAEVAHRRLDALSGGMNRLAMLAVATVHDPAVLLLDEPTAGVDVEHRALVRRFLLDRAERCCVVMSTHLDDDVEQLAQRVVVLASRHLVFDGGTDELRALGNERLDHETELEAALRRLVAGPVLREVS